MSMGLCPTRAMTGRSNYWSVTEPFDIVEKWAKVIEYYSYCCSVSENKTVRSINLI